MEDFEVPVFKKAYDFYRKLFVCVENFPKHIKYTIGQRCEHLLAEILADILQASQVPKTDKIAYLKQASRNLNLLRIQVRLLKDVGALDQSVYIEFQAVIDDIGRQLGGWNESISPSFPRPQ